MSLSCLNNNGNMSDLVVSNFNCIVDRNYLTFVSEDVYHPCLSIKLNGLYLNQYSFAINCDSKEHNFKKADFISLYNDFFKCNWDFSDKSTEWCSGIFLC